MQQFIEINDSRLIQIIREFEFNEFTTVDLLEAYQGAYYPNIGTSVSDSFNAQFGKYLSDNHERLGIEKAELVERKVPVEVIQDGNVSRRFTTCQKWRRTN